MPQFQIIDPDINTTQQIAPEVSSESPSETISEEPPRMVAHENGEIVFATPSFADLIGMSEAPEGQDIKPYFDISQMEDNTPYEIKNKKTRQAYTLYMNRVAGQNNVTYIVLHAEDAETGSTNQAAEKLYEYVQSKVQGETPQPEQTIAPAITSSSNDKNIFYNLSPDLFITTDLGGSVIESNQSNPEQKNILDFISDQDRAEFQAILRDIHSGQEIYVENRTSDQQIISWTIQCQNTEIFFYGRNITDLRKIESNLSRQKEKLDEAEAIGHIGQWYWRIGGEEIEFSNQLYTIFGKNSNEFSPTLSRINRIIHRRDLGRMMQVFQRAIIERKDYDMDFRIKHSDGSIRYIRCEGRCKLDSEGDVSALYGIMQDVTEARSRERDIRMAKESMERAYNAKSQFLANMSHELRTPLNAIIGFSEMMERQLLGPLGNEKYLDYMKGIRESGEHLLDLISDILDMSKIEAGKYELNLEEFNPAKVIRLAVHMMEGRALDDNVKLTIDIDSEDLKIVGDRRAVMQMVLNLLSNAVKFSKENGHVQMKMTTQDSGITIIVEDNGIGIPANKLANITMPFEQAECDYTREYEGTGLGLSITKELAEIHGGSLNIESTVDVGTTVTINLPLNAYKNA